MSASSLPEQQNALLIAAKGQSMKIGERPVPKPGAGQVIVRNIAVAINPADMYIQKYGVFLKDEDLPAVIGEDGAGEVCALGGGVQGWNIGDKVFYEGQMAVSDVSTFQEYTLVNIGSMARIPSNITIEQAATIPLGLATASLGLYKPRSDSLHPAGYDLGGTGLTPPWAPDGMGKYSGKAALVIGGSSSVGQFALQLLHASGFSPLITTASARNADYCKAAGATHVVDYNATPYDQLPQAIKEIVGDTVVDTVYNAIASGTQEAAFAVLAHGGGMASVSKPVIGERGKDDEQGRRVVWVYGDVNIEGHRAFGEEMYANLTPMLESGELKPNKFRVLDGGLSAVPGGCDELEKGVSAVKLVVRIRE